jgi:hypothetical protein
MLTPPVFFAAAHRATADGYGVDALASSPIFDDAIDAISATKVTVFHSGEDSTFKEESIIDAKELTKAILKGQSVVVHAPTQSGKTTVDVLAMAYAFLAERPCITIVSASVASIDQVRRGSAYSPLTP